LGFRVLFPGVSAVFLREGYAGNVSFCRVLVVVQITSSLLSVRDLELLLFVGGVAILPWSQWEALGLCALQEAGLLAPEV
jgi:hypothetical protein